jgi:hypothetical protein
MHKEPAQPYMSMYGCGSILWMSGFLGPYALSIILRAASAKLIGRCGAGHEFLTSDRIPETYVGLCCWGHPLGHWGTEVLGGAGGMFCASVVWQSTASNFKLEI